MKLDGRDQHFIVVGENVHCTRVLLRKGKRIGPGPDGQEAVLWQDGVGQARSLTIPQETTTTSDYQEGRVKHVQIAVKLAMAGAAEAGEAMDYLRHLVSRQEQAGVDFLDLNVDEISYKHQEQLHAMQWLVRTVQSMTDVPLSVDSSLLATIDVGIQACARDVGRRPLLNSASLERTEPLDLAARHDAQVIITAAGASGMPEGSHERVNNASKMIDMALDKGIELADIHVDLLVFPISVDSRFGLHYLDAVRPIREKYGPAIHITGGMSNVSFGIPARRLVNEVFINLAIDHGADAGILDPVAGNINSIVALDRSTPPYKLARQMLLGEDEHCKHFLRAFRKGELG